MITITLHPHGYCITTNQVTETVIETLEQARNSLKNKLGLECRDEYFSYDKPTGQLLQIEQN